MGWPLVVVPSFLIYFGALLNQIALAVNGGYMPVFAGGCWNQTNDPNGVMDPMHTCMSVHTHLKFLCDWINLQPSVLSIGDVCIYGGMALSYPFFLAWLTLLFVCAAKKTDFHL